VPLDAVFRDQWGRVLAILVGIFGDIELAEDAAAEAFAIAAERWPRDGEPANPTGWLVTTARHRAIDHLRRRQVLADKTRLLAHDLETGPPPAEALMDDTATIPDERLELIFACCHPSLVLEAQVALTLRTLGGRAELAAEAIHLGRALADLMPDEPEALALLALMLLHDARRAARLSDGQTVPLDEQDRALWDAQQIDEGRALLRRALAHGSTGPYLVQAAIADLHLHQPRDWRQIAALYGTLARQTRSSIVEMNRAIAVAEIDGPDAGLAILDGLRLDHYRYYHSTRAELLRRSGREAEAHDAYRRALDLAQTEPEQRLLTERLAETTPSVPSEPS
jgi:predicted RNA polymerase sigma factor